MFISYRERFNPYLHITLPFHIHFGVGALGQHVISVTLNTALITSIIFRQEPWIPSPHQPSPLRAIQRSWRETARGHAARAPVRTLLRRAEMPVRAATARDSYTGTVFWLVRKRRIFLYLYYVIAIANHFSIGQIETEDFPGISRAINSRSGVLHHWINFRVEWHKQNFFSCILVAEAIITQEQLKALNLCLQMSLSTCSKFSMKIKNTPKTLVVTISIPSSCIELTCKFCK